MTIQQIRRPINGEYRYYRGDKGMHFMNTLAAVDFRGMFIHVEAGFAGRMTDNTAYNHSLLRQRLVNNNGILPYHKEN